MPPLAITEKELAFFIDGRIDIKPVLQSCLVVFFAVPRSDMDCAGAGIGGNIIGKDDDRLPVEEWVSEGQFS